MKNARGARACVDMAEEVGFRVRSAAAAPPSQARSGEFLKTLHWSVFALRAGIPPHRFESLEVPWERKSPRGCEGCGDSGGGGGIRTLVTRVAGKTVFETAAFNHSATPPLWGARPIAPHM